MFGRTTQAPVRKSACSWVSAATPPQPCTPGGGVQGPQVPWWIDREGPPGAPGRPGRRCCPALRPRPGWSVVVRTFDHGQTTQVSGSVAEGGGPVVADPLPHRRRPAEFGVLQQLAFVESAGVEADRADQVAPAGLLEAVEEFGVFHAGDQADDGFMCHALLLRTVWVRTGRRPG